MEKVIVEPCYIIGITIRTTNENNQMAKDIGGLWQRFTDEQIIDLIPNKIDKTIYSIYTDYEKDHTKPYTTWLGCKVKSLESIPKGMMGTYFEGGNYLKFTSKGDLTKGLVIQEWLKIWAMDLDRTFAADFEVYGDKAKDIFNAEVDILIGVK